MDFEERIANLEKRVEAQHYTISSLLGVISGRCNAVLDEEKNCLTGDDALVNLYLKHTGLT